MAERRVRVTIKIDPAGALCGACEWTDDNGLECRIFRAPLDWDDVNGPVRCVGCLSLDDVGGGGEAGRLAVTRALLERDVADVAFHVVDFQEEVEDLDTQVHSSELAIERYGDSAIGAAREHRKMAELIETRENWVAKIEDCQAWLTRARAALA